VFTLVAPATLPVGYLGGFYLEAASPPYSANGPHLDRDVDAQPLTAVVSSAEGGPLAHPYTDDGSRRDFYDRWTLRLERADGPARITVTYQEYADEKSGGRSTCIRRLSAVVRPTPVRDPHMRLRTRVHRFFATDDPTGYTGDVADIRVSGRMARTARHPVRLVVSEGDLVRIFDTVRPRHGRITARIRLHTGGLTNPLHVRAIYPGDVDETWPCDDVFSSGPYDGCRQRLHAPRGTVRTHD
jgi:hypothetical protein